MPNSRTAATAPSTLTPGAWSPPIASTAMRILPSVGEVTTAELYPSRSVASLARGLRSRTGLRLARTRARTADLAPRGRDGSRGARTSSAALAEIPRAASGEAHSGETRTR